MSTYKEFQAKTVDQAIEDACRFFAVGRDGLEIDIISGGSAGIFGLGAKKASIRAQKRRIINVVETATIRPEEAAPIAAAQVHSKIAPPVAEDEILEAEFEDEDEPREAALLSPEEQHRLAEDIERIMTALLLPITTTPRLTIDTGGNPITVHIDDNENSGLIIGRDGHTITALQYLTNRIVSKTWPRSPRIQLDAGDYRQKQEEQLLSIALFLSEKAKKSGRVQSTRPLSSFHRRVVHMALQNDRGVQTRSKGEGPLKRVLILPVKRGKTGNRPFKRHEPAQARQS